MDATTAQQKRPLVVTPEAAKKSKPANDDGTDGNPNPNLDPALSAAIPINALTDQTSTPVDCIKSLSHSYQVKSTQLEKAKHHHEFLSQSFAELKIPQGLQWQTDFHVMHETEEFRQHIKTIQICAEMKIVNALSSHYKELAARLTTEVADIEEKLSQLQTNTEMTKNIQEAKHQQQTLANKLQIKRTNKLKRNITHIERTETYMRVPPSQPKLNRRPPRLNQQPRNYPLIQRPPYQPPNLPTGPTSYQLPPNQPPTRPNQPLTRPNQPPTRINHPPDNVNHNTAIEGNMPVLVDLIKQLIHQALSSYHPPNYPPASNNYYR